jgi:ubiquinone/menaquinone biosynthesis C-methylase UbiE
MSAEKDYVLGTHDEEIERLGLQHRMWRSRALDGWRRGGFTRGQTLVDIGCGPGYAATDLAEVVGPEGRVIALDRSRRFLDALEARGRRLGLANIEVHELDLDESELPAAAADGAWSRWVFAFVQRPRDLLARVGRMLRPGGTLVMQEYFDYSTWRLSPRSTEFEAFVQQVITSWRASGGEPDVGLDLPRWLVELGFEIRSLTPIIEVVHPADSLWQWPRAFVEVGLRRMVDLGEVTRERAAGMAESFHAAERDPHSLLVTPAVIEVVATRK